MAIVFTQEEQDAIAKQALPADQLPSYFVPESNTQAAISKDFEGYLILQTADQKQDISEWIDSLKDIDSANADRDEILQRYLGYRADNAATVIQDIDEASGGFEKFKSNLAPGTSDSPSKFADLLELNLLSRAMQRPLDEILIQRELAFHEQNMAKILQTALDTKAAGEKTAAELDQWQIVMGTYKGQSK